MWRLAVQQKGEVVKYMSDKDITPELCQMAIEQDINNQSYIPNGLLNENMMFYIISKRKHMFTKRYNRKRCFFT